MVGGMNTASALCSPGHVAATKTLRSVDLRGPAGRLEAVLNEGSADAPFAALVCHPHPLGGGSLHNKVVYHAMKVLNASDWGLCWPVLRFNFRGVGLSEGEHDGGAETDDVRAAVDWLENAYKRPLVVAGFSFGAAMALAACCGDSDVKALVALGLPTHAEGRDYRYPFLGECGIPKLFLSGDCDQYAPATELLKITDAAADPKKVIQIPGGDHFFSGQLRPMQTALAGWLKEQVQ
jgi:hypothetical protein